MVQDLVQYLENKRIAILGFGREGKSTYRFIRKYLEDLPLSIFDSCLSSCDDFFRDDKNVFVYQDYQSKGVFNDYDLIIKSPGISLKNMEIDDYRHKITSQIQLLLQFFDILTIGVTGTKGKSTTTTLIYEILKGVKKSVIIGGNIGIPVFDHLEEINKDTIYVIELSAYQLQYLKNSPNIAVLLNLFEEHLDFFGSIDQYYQSKINIMNYQDSNDVVFYNGDSQNVLNYVHGHIRGKSYLVGDNDTSEEGSLIYCKDHYICMSQNGVENILYDCRDKRLLLGSNNLKDIMFVLGVCRYLNLDMKVVIDVINTFPGLEHRMEYVGCYNCIHYYNDAIATIPEAVINNIKAVENVDTLIFGGMDRGIDYSKFIDYLKSSKIGNLICMPDTGTKIGKVLLESKCKSNIYFVNNLEEAVAKASKVTKQNKSCMMSPAASSYNQFKDFEEKGNCFKKLVKQYYE